MSPLAKLTVSDLRLAAHKLMQTPRVSARDDVEFHAGLLQLLADIQAVFEPTKNVASLLAQASSYESSEHFELSLAAIFGLLETVGREVENTQSKLPSPGTE